MKRSSLSFVLSAAAIALVGLTSAHAAVDADAAQALFKKNECNKCHAVDKTKKGPALKKVAEKYKGKADGQEKVIKNLTTGPEVKMDDGSTEKHKIVDTKDAAAIKNLADWILAQ